jgi:urease subunit alpha
MTPEQLGPDEYAALYGPTTGDRVHLGDTGLVVEVEHDSQLRGDEFLMGFGKTARDGLLLKAVPVEQSCDLVLSNVLLIDPLLGIRKTSIGIRAGRVAAVGRAGNPDLQPDVDVVVGTGTAVINADGLIATPGGIDTHVHLLSPRILAAELSSGMTTVLAQEFGPVWGVGVSSPWGLGVGNAALEAFPVNLGFLGRGSSSRPEPIVQALVDGGACGLKVHEDTGAHPRALDTALTVAEEHDVQVALHTDGLNESLEVRDTLAVLDGRVIHAFHVEGCGGGHVPNVLELAGVPHVIGSSTNPTLPYGRDAEAEHLEMILACHGLNKAAPGDLALAADRIRPTTMGAEGVLHDRGLIPITSSDAQGMGRAGETFRRTFALAARMKQVEQPDGEQPRNDNERVLRYLAKLTVNPALAHGLAHEVGTIAPGRLADVVLWRPALFGAKPLLVLKGGFPAWGVTGDPNAATDACQPLVIGPQVGGYGGAPAELSVAFVSAASVAAHGDRTTGGRRRVAVAGCRDIRLGAMVRHTAGGSVRVDPRTAGVTLDGEPVGVPPADSVSLSRLYYL